MHQKKDEVSDKQERMSCAEFEWLVATLHDYEKNKGNYISFELQSLVFREVHEQSAT